MHLSTSHDYWVVQKGEAETTIFIAFVVFELHNFCLFQNVDDILELSLLSRPYSSIKTRVAFDFLRQQLHFSTAACQTCISAVMRARQSRGKPGVYRVTQCRRLELL